MKFTDFLPTLKKFWKFLTFYRPVGTLLTVNWWNSNMDGICWSSDRVMAGLCDSYKMKKLFGSPKWHLSVYALFTMRRAHSYWILTARVAANFCLTVITAVVKGYMGCYSSMNTWIHIYPFPISISIHVAISSIHSSHKWAVNWWNSHMARSHPPLHFGIHFIQIIESLPSGLDIKW